MKEVSPKGVRTIPKDEEDIYRDPPGQIGLTQRIFEEIDKDTVIPIPRGVYRFKTHEEMNKQWDDAMDEIVRAKQAKNRERWGRNTSPAKGKLTASAVVEKVKSLFGLNDRFRDARDQRPK